MLLMKTQALASAWFARTAESSIELLAETGIGVCLIRSGVALGAQHGATVATEGYLAVALGVVG
jgi:hypothetical protein